MKMLKTALLAVTLLLLASETKAQIFAAGGNILPLSLLALQGECSAAVSKRWTVSVDISARPVTANRLFMVRASGRRYREEAYTGFFFSVSAGYLNYKLENRHGSGFITGAGCGYSFLLTERLDLTLEGGVSLLLARDFRYIRTPEPFSPDYKARRIGLTAVPFPLALTVTYIF